jgi:secreted trypsin-like serine protease
MNSISNSQCADNHIGTIGEGQVTDEKICFLAPNNASSCGGDSGGPVIWKGTVIGVCSWTVRPCGSHPTVYIRTSSHAGWLQRHI